MDQYTLLIPQNIASTGLTFTERTVLLNKGDLLTVDSSHVPTTLPVGTNYYLLQADTAQASGLNWVSFSSLISGTDLMVYKGVIDASGNPNYPAADAGNTYIISVAGKIGGVSGITV